LILIAGPGGLKLGFSKLQKIISLIWLASANQFRALQIENTILSVESLLRLYPNIEQQSEGELDRERRMEQSRQDLLRYQAVLGCITNKANVFVISTSGVYKQVILREKAQNKISIDQMIDRSLDQVLELETAFYLLKQIREAYAAAEQRLIEYEISGKHYRSQIIPIQGAEEIVLIQTSGQNLTLF
jgi:mannose/fructose/N-acetylgalactosamine-specific phosphotransferase system component IIB